jgi:hypothetical protein
VTSERFRTAIAAIDDANRLDPNTETFRGLSGPKEVVHAVLATEWVTRLAPDADEALLLAARGHHLRRWTMPRASYPPGRSSYLKWRAALHQQHARELGEILVAAGYDEMTVVRVQALVRKERLGRPGADPAVQVLEDALCLVFLETQLGDVATRLEPETLTRVIVKTAAKMSDAGRACIPDLPLGPGARRLLDEALARDVVGRYLDAMAAHDWNTLAATLALDVDRMGPYRDRFQGREPYAEYLRTTISALGGYTLVVERMIADGGTVAVELSETVDDGDARLHTDETVVFDVRDGLIARVAVYLQTSERQPRGN